MAATNQQIRRESLLQEGVSCALATLHAIEGAGLFQALPAEGDADQHNHGTALLGMLEDQLRRIQQQVDALSGFPSPPTAEDS
jgi:hypothetical protein